MRESTLAVVRRLVLPVVWAVGILIPLGYLVLTSLRTRSDFATNPTGWPTAFTLENYVTAWSGGLLVTGFVNNLIVTVISAIGVVALGSAASYGIARWTSRWSTALRIYAVIGLIVPFQLGLPTLLRIWVSLGLANTLPGAALIHIGSMLPLAMFLYLGFLLTVPKGLEEAARIDGAGEVRLFTSIVFPLLAPITATLVVLSFIFVWNDLLISVFFLSDASVYTLPRINLGLSNSLQTNVPALMATAVISVLPVVIIFVVFQRHFVAGLTSGAIKD